MTTCRLFLGLLLAALVVLGGCADPNERKPVPLVDVQILDQAGAFRYEGRRLFQAELRDELQRLADRNRRPRVGTARVIVHVFHSSRVPYNRVQELISYMGQIGLDKVEVRMRETDLPDEPAPLPAPPR